MIAKASDLLRLRSTTSEWLGIHDRGLTKQEGQSSTPLFLALARPTYHEPSITKGATRISEPTLDNSGLEVTRPPQ